MAAEKQAFISSFGTDQGTGWSQCSACSYELDAQILDKWKAETLRAIDHNLKRKGLQSVEEDMPPFQHSQD